MNRLHKILPICVFVALAYFISTAAATQQAASQQPAPQKSAPQETAPQENNTQPEYDIVIRGGRVLDGAGNPCIMADVAIKDRRFVKIGKIDGRGRKEIDARGRYVSPGWIDMMDQSGEALTKNGLAENKLMEGVTTAIAGEGGTPVPPEQLREYWTTLEKNGISLNFGTYFSETQARRRP